MGLMSLHQFFSCWYSSEGVLVTSTRAEGDLARVYSWAVPQSLGNRISDNQPGVGLAGLQFSQLHR
jgi:hypothetical protein